MASGTIPGPGNIAGELSDEFLDMSMAIDQLRASSTNLSPADALRLGTAARQLDEWSDQLNAAAVAQILANIQPQLNNIRQATQAAKDALKKIADIQKAFNIACAAVSLASAILTGNLDTIASAVGGVASAVASKRNSGTGGASAGGGGGGS